MERRRDAAAVQQQDRLAATLGHTAQRTQERRRQRIAGLAPQVDDVHGRQVGADPPAELEPLERRPALRPRRRGAEDRDRAFERRALRRDRARVVARVGVLLVRRVVLLVDDDQPEPADRREDRGARADDDARLAARDPRTLVAPLGVGERRVEDRDPVAEARAHPADRLRRERDLGHEHDRPEAALEHRRARLQVHLGLAGAGRAVEQEVAASPFTIRSTAAICGSESCSGSASPVSACRSAGGACSLRRFGVSGATSASARAGVEP